MGTIRAESGRRWTLGSRTLVGRSDACALRLEDPRVSGEHAAIFHRASRWFVRDLASRNGTLLNDRFLPPGKAQGLSMGDRLTFGSRAASSWVLADEHPPGPRAVADADGQLALAGASSLLVIPDGDGPGLTVHADEAHWVAEHVAADDVFHAVDQMEVEVAGQRWRLELPSLEAQQPDPGTTARGPAGFRGVAGVSLRLQHSRDEEYVRMTARVGVQRHVLDGRAFHYMMLVLARARLGDMRRGDLAPDEHGWVHAEDLAKDLGISRPRLNVYIFRARRQLEGLGVEDAARIIQRRPQTQQLRLGVENLQVAPL